MARRRPKAEPEGLDEDSHWELLQQCLTDTTMLPEVRAAGALLLLFGQHATRIAARHTSALDTTAIRCSSSTGPRSACPNPSPASSSTLPTSHRPPDGGGPLPPRWLFPGIRPGQHISATTLCRRLTAHHIPIRPARTTALVQLAQDLPPAILAPMLGLHVVTAQHWRRRAATDWTAYLQARRASSRAKPAIDPGTRVNARSGHAADRVTDRPWPPGHR
ncbi:hypothetical protein ACIPYS_07875 [Kitasatospora sp. NPDC089913]|uniref:hypothetical protein n=1 Tax=Kitasatospora TaxID=2063 RepID=UPI0033CA6804